ncbi:MULTISPECIES: response regulator [Paenibacillus]|uniref:response regulator n=1 Tax=Paenibacillus TaxID=44249 RepID=UPI0022B9116C|nr:response regulator [Paenibacillus caseinilyticus]MCZ8522418.1 response regulator [Paenibacillus caseinilyticus]
MLQILIVDDEAIERDGIRFLIRKFGLELTVLEAENGEEALEVLAEHPVDILFTDIKMPFMDGLELCRRARERYAALRIIIYSAYGEFEYAQQAIRYGIQSYVLKPIDVQEFRTVLMAAMELCRQEKALEAQQITLRDGYHKGLVYEKEKQLLDLIGGRADVEALESLAQAGVPLRGRRIQMMLVHFEGRFFGSSDQSFQNDIRELVRDDWELVHLNESQCLLLVLTPESLASNDTAADIGERLQQRLTAGYGQPCTVVVGRPETAGGLKDEYERMEGLLENQFFYKEGTVFYTDRTQAGRPLPADALAELLDRLYWHLEAKDDYGFRRGMGLFFETVRRSGQHSVIYTKYLCMELTRKALHTAGREGEPDWSHYAEELFSCRSLEELESSVQRALDLIPMEDAHESGALHTKKVIKDVVGLIEEHYMHDISLSWIAEQVHLTQTYLSYLFSREKGQPLIKYITGVRMQKAAELLIGSHLTVAQISERTGYTSDSYFGKIFKNHYGVSPAKYRERSS